MTELIDKLHREHSLTLTEYEELIRRRSDFDYLKSLANKERERIYGKSVFIRGLIEISSYCKNDCLYCGLRRSNKNCERYRLSKEQILECTEEGYRLGFRTFVLQGGEDGYYTDEFLCSTVSAIKKNHPDCAVTLSLGERSRKSYKQLFDAGADRYLLRHETATDKHYSKLHPEDMTLDTRIKALYHLKEIGFQVGCGFMVGSPFQSEKEIAKDLKFIEEFRPEMCGIGPFIPQSDTPFGSFPAGSVDLTLYLLSVIRLIIPSVLLPATTALGSIKQGGREMGILSGANVIMPNLSPKSVRSKYKIYDNKLFVSDEAAEQITKIKQNISSIGYEVVTDRGDYKGEK